MRRLLMLGVSAVTLAACTLQPPYVRPSPAIPPSWPVGAAYAPAAPEAALPAVTYRQVFRDPHLQAIIDRALANNQNLRSAMANVEIARGQYRGQNSELLPHVRAAGSASEGESHVARVGPDGVTTTRREFNRSYDLNIGFTAFEIDLFGRLRSLSHAAQQQYLSSVAGARAARLTLVGEVANAYLALAADRSLLAISRETEASAARTVELTRAKLAGGVSPRRDLSQAETLLDQARSDRAELTTRVAQDRNALEFLVGSPVPDADLPTSIESVDGQLGEAPAGLDSRILLGRPDVLQAEHRLRAANAQIGAARAAFFPTISLTQLAGVASPQLASLFAGRNFVWQTQGAASLPIFSGGANLAGLAIARGERDLALAAYQQAIQTAFREVADALARRGTIREQMAAQTALEAAASSSYALSLARYREGIDPYLATLDAQRTLYSVRRSLAASRLVQAQNLAALYQSLGGDSSLDVPPGAQAGSSPTAPSRRLSASPDPDR